MIASGEKKEEYRENKTFWKSRLYCKPTVNGYKSTENFRKFDYIHFSNGYGQDAPSIFVECKEIEINTGKLEWGAIKGVFYFVIKLGEIIKK